MSPQLQGTLSAVQVRDERTELPLNTPLRPGPQEVKSVVVGHWKRGRTGKPVSLTAPDLDGTLGPGVLGLVGGLRQAPPGTQLPVGPAERSPDFLLGTNLCPHRCPV